MTMSDRIKQKELPDVKEILIKQQKGRCAFCGKSLRSIKPVNQVVDHCHVTGRIRSVACRGCNGAEGKILRLAKTWGKCQTDEQARNFILDLADYWKHHRENPSPWIYPKHKTPEEAKEARLKKSRKAYAKAKAARKEKIK